MTTRKKAASIITVLLAGFLVAGVADRAGIDLGFWLVLATAVTTIYIVKR
jgi:hypothetical protein